MHNGPSPFSAQGSLWELTDSNQETNDSAAWCANNEPPQIEIDNLTKIICPLVVFNIIFKLDQLFLAIKN